MSPQALEMNAKSIQNSSKQGLRRIDNSSVIGMVSVKGEEVKDEHSEHAYTYTAATKEELNDALIIRAKRTRVTAPLYTQS